MPQLIARINQPSRLVRMSIHSLLREIGRAHPQALVYPLTVSIKSDVKERSRAAREIMNSMEQHSGDLCREAASVSHELIRIAVLWHEQWHEGLEEASRLYDTYILSMRTKLTIMIGTLAMMMLKASLRLWSPSTKCSTLDRIPYARSPLSRVSDEICKKLATGATHTRILETVVT